MRPVNKGASPYTSIREYGDALPYLEDTVLIAEQKLITHRK